MACTGQRVTVTATATRLTERATTVGEKTAIYLRNRGTESVDLGGPDVATGEGFELVAGAGMAVDILGRDDPYAVAAAGHTVRVDVFGSGF